MKRGVYLRGEEEVEGDLSYSSFSCWSFPRVKELICVMNILLGFLLYVCPSY